MAAARLASVDGAIGDPAEATISILDDGLLRGDGAFEMIKLYEGHPFALGPHIDRLARSAAAIELGLDRGAIEREAAAVVAAAGPLTGGLRIVLTRGGRRLMLVEELPEWPASARIAIVTLTPSEILAGVKSISYAGNMQASRIAAARGADEAVYATAEGIVLEAPTSSVFWADADGSLRTPALATGILDSITRDVVIAGSEVEQGAFAVGELKSAREAFLASTTREIQPISSVDGVELPNPAGGPAAAAASRVLADAVSAEREGPPAPRRE